MIAEGTDQEIEALRDHEADTNTKNIKRSRLMFYLESVCCRHVADSFSAEYTNSVNLIGD